MKINEENIMDLEGISEASPKNQRALVMFYLVNYKDFSLKDLINDSMFFKFQTRLSEIENDIGYPIALRVKKSFINRFGRKSNFNLYNLCIDSNKAIELYKDFNR